MTVIISSEVDGSEPATGTERLVASTLAFGDIPRAEWDRLLGVTPAATPFSRWTFHRAWWDAYGSTAHEQYLVCRPPDADAADADAIRAIVPLMHRHEVEPEDAATATRLRGRSRPCTEVQPTAKAVFFGASYHADYATILCAEPDLPAAGRAIGEALAGEPDRAHGGDEWDVVDLRRLRADDPCLPALEAALNSALGPIACAVVREQEDVCPVVSLPEAGDWDGYLATLDRKGRHEIRRKLRRAESAGELRFADREPSAASIERFIELHQQRWGEEGLFPATEGGARSRRFLERLAELELAEATPALRVGELTVDGRVIFSGLSFDDATTCYFYNAGTATDARDFSPGVVGTAELIRDRLATGTRRIDFLRGDEPYKYEWGARDEPIYRLLVTRFAAR